MISPARASDNATLNVTPCSTSLDDLVRLAQNADVFCSHSDLLVRALHAASFAAAGCWGSPAFALPPIQAQHAIEQCPREDRVWEPSHGKIMPSRPEVTVKN